MRNAGFSLVEIMVVVVIMSVLAGVVMMNLSGKADEAKRERTRADLQSIKAALFEYESKFGNLPTMAQGLESLIRIPTSPPVPKNYPAGGLLSKNTVPKDGWNNDFQYLVPGSEGEPFEVISFGKDGERGGDGVNEDISSSGL